jgi:hypothetical protein
VRQCFSQSLFWVLQQNWHPPVTLLTILSVVQIVTWCPSAQCYAAPLITIPWETAMPEIDDISARLTVLEMVVMQLITHLAVRTDNPKRWVQTRKVLALNAIAVTNGPSGSRIDRINDAVAGLFGQAELVAAEYGPPTEGGTHGRFMR